MAVRGRQSLVAACHHLRHYTAPAIPPAKLKYLPTSGSYPKGFLVASVHAGVKASNTKHHDMALIVSQEPCAAAAVFTRNLFGAAPVQVSKRILTQRASAGLRGVLVNSGCANAVTGKGGLEDAIAMARKTDAQFGVTQPAASTLPALPQTLVMSTGVIGQRLPMDKITSAIPKLHAALASEHEHWLNAAQAICTTDTFPKLLTRTFTLPSHPDTQYSIAGMAKGAGMIHPNMATLLAVIATDVAIVPKDIKTLLLKATDRSFNCISIDGDTSTNDTVALFANGAAAPPATLPISCPRNTGKPASKPSTAPQASQPATPESPDCKVFRQVLTEFMEDLAKLVVRDGEGATKFITVRVQSTKGYFTAKRVAVSIATSSLVKTALYGKDANWGRILSAIGHAPGIVPRPEVSLVYPKPEPIPERRQVTPERVSVSFVPADGSEELKLVVRGEPEQVDEARAKEILEMEDLEILVKLDDLGDFEKMARSATGKKSVEAVFWTCDFTHEYVTINADYRT